MPDERRPVLGVVAGPNGSGKTTITEEILRHKWLTGCAYINPDNIAQELGDWNDPKLTLKAARQAEKEPERLLRQKESMAFETVFSAPDKLDYVRRAHEAGYFIRFFFVSTDSPAINAARVTTRYMSGGHAVPIEKTVDRYYRSIEQCMKAIPWVDRLDVFDNTVGISGCGFLNMARNGTSRYWRGSLSQRGPNLSIRKLSGFMRLVRHQSRLLMLCRWWQHERGLAGCGFCTAMPW